MLIYENIEAGKVDLHVKAGAFGNFALGFLAIAAVG